jgi:mxaJ protein
VRRAAVVLLIASGCALQPLHALTVCADPNNLPFSNRQGQGFENKLAAMLARDLHEPIQYLWWAQRRGFARNTVAQSKCDLWPGVASGIERMSTSRPYYRSSYVFVTRASRPLPGLTLDDPRLKTLTIGVQLIGYDGTNTPPAQALADRGLTQNIRGFMLFGDYRKPSPPAAIVEAVADGSIDTAIVWGPVAGYFAQQANKPLRLQAVHDEGMWKMSYDVSVGVRRGDTALLQRVNAALASESTAIERLLVSYHVPMADSSAGHPSVAAR